MTARFTLDEVAIAAAARVDREGPFGLRAPIDGIFTDSRKPAPGALFVALAGENHDGAAFAESAARAGAAGVLVAHKQAARIASVFAEARLPSAVLSCTDPGRALLGLARAWRGRMPTLRLVAITGSAGKTSTKELVASVLSAEGSTLKTEGNLNNEIGVPLTLLQLAREHRFAAIECGMNHLGEIARLCAAADPDVALVTNVAPVHLEGCGSIDGVAHAKGELFHGLRANGVAIANADDARVLGQAKLSMRKLITFGTAEGADVRLLSVRHAGAGLEVELVLRGKQELAQLSLIGLHNGVNAAAAAAAGLALGIRSDVILRGLALARTPGRRMRPTKLASGALLLDDCYNANPASMRAAFDTVATLRRDGGRALLVLGDMLELGPTELELHRDVGQAAAAISPSLLLCFGTRARAYADGARAAGLSDSAIVLAETPEAALGALQSRLGAADLVLVKGSRGMKMERISDPLAGVAEAGAH